MTYVETGLEKKYELANDNNIPLIFIFKKNREWKTLSYFFENGESLKDAFANIKNEESIKIRKSDKLDMLENISSYYYKKISENMEEIKELYSKYDNIVNVPSEVFLLRKWDILLDKTKKDYEEAKIIFERVKNLRKGKNIPPATILDVERTIYLEDKRGYEINSESGYIIFDELRATKNIPYILYKITNDKFYYKVYKDSKVINLEKYSNKITNNLYENIIIFFYQTPIGDFVPIEFVLELSFLKLKCKDEYISSINQEILKCFKDNISLPYFDIDGSSGFFELNFPDYDEFKFYFIIMTKKFPNRLFYIDESYSSRYSKSSDVKFKFRKIPSNEKVISFKIRKIKGDRYRIDFESDDYDYIEEFIGVLTGFTGMYSCYIEELNDIFEAFYNMNLKNMFIRSTPYSTIEPNTLFTLTNIKNYKQIIKNKTPVLDKKDKIFTFKVVETPNTGYQIQMVEGKFDEMKELIFSGRYFSYFKKIIEKIKTDSKLDNLREADEILFGGNYQNKCQCERQPIKIDREDVEKWSKVRNIIEYPPGKGDFYACPENPTPEMYLILNDKSEDFVQRPLLPCCGKTKDERLEEYLTNYSEIIENPEEYNFYISEKRTKNIIIKTMSELIEGQIGEISNIMLNIFLDNIEKDKTFLRLGMGKNTKSFLNCLNKALNKTARRKDISKSINPNLLRQEFYDKTEEEIIDYILDRDNNFSSDLFLLALEHYFNVNIFVFLMEKPMKYNPVLEIPRHAIYHSRRINPELESVIILKHKRSNSYELLFKRITDQKEIFVFDKRYTIALFNIYKRASYNFLNINEREKSFNNFFKDYKFKDVVSQHINTLGKAYAFNIRINEDEIITIYTIPICPYSVKISDKIYYSDKTTVENYLSTLHNFSFKLGPGGLYVLEQDEQNLNKSLFFIPLKDSENKEEFYTISKPYILEKNSKENIKGIREFDKVKTDSSILQQIFISKWKNSGLDVESWFKNYVVKTKKYPRKNNGIIKRLENLSDEKLEYLNKDIFNDGKIYMYDKMYINMFRYMTFLQRRLDPNLPPNKIVQLNYKNKTYFELSSKNKIYLHKDEFNFSELKDTAILNYPDKNIKEYYFLNIKENPKGSIVIIRNVKSDEENSSFVRSLAVSYSWKYSLLIKGMIRIGPYNIKPRAIEIINKNNYSYRIFQFSGEKSNLELVSSYNYDPDKKENKDFLNLNILKYEKSNIYAAILTI